MIKLNVVGGNTLGQAQAQVLWLRQFTDIIGICIDESHEPYEDETRVRLYLLSGNVQVTTWKEFKKFQGRLKEGPVG